MPMYYDEPAHLIANLMNIRSDGGLGAALLSKDLVELLD